MPTRKITASPVKLTGIAPDGQQFESHLEEDFFVLLRFNRNVKHWESHPITIDWLDESGRVRKYTPDVLVEYKPDEVGAEPVWVLCEVKPDFDSDEDLPRKKLPRRETDADNKLKWEAAERYAARRKWQFKVYRESDIRTPYLRNARFLLRFLERRSSMRGRQELLDILKTQGACTLARWVSPLASTPEQRANFLPTCYRLIAEGYVKIDMSKILTLDSFCEYVNE